MLIWPFRMISHTGNQSNPAFSRDRVREPYGSRLVMLTKNLFMPLCHALFFFKGKAHNGMRVLKDERGNLHEKHEEIA